MYSNKYLFLEVEKYFPIFPFLFFNVKIFNMVAKRPRKATDMVLNEIVNNWQSIFKCFQDILEVIVELEYISAHDQRTLSVLHITSALSGRYRNWKGNILLRLLRGSPLCGDPRSHKYIFMQKYEHTCTKCDIVVSGELQVIIEPIKWWG